MTYHSEPNPPARRDEDFPKTTTIPDGWVTESIMATYNRDVEADCAKQLNNAVQEMPVPATGMQSERSQEELFSRRLDPFPSGTELTGSYL